MEIEEEDAVATSEHGGETWHFCSRDCKEAFDESPEDNVWAVAGLGAALTVFLAGTMGHSE